MYEILRPISGVDAKPGDIVDASGWTALRELERQGYIRRYVPAPDRALERRGGRHAQN